jgi:hypothetical protein
VKRCSQEGTNTSCKNRLACSILLTPARRISFTKRSCKVPKSRSMRPLACGERAAIQRMSNSRSARPN